MTKFKCMFQGRDKVDGTVDEDDVVGRKGSRESEGPMRARRLSDNVSRRADEVSGGLVTTAWFERGWFEENNNTGVRAMLRQ